LDQTPNWPGQSQAAAITQAGAKIRTETRRGEDEDKRGWRRTLFRLDDALFSISLLFFASSIFMIFPIRRLIFQREVDSDSE
jgi:hypothetical protein